MLLRFAGAIVVPVSKSFHVTVNGVSRPHAVGGGALTTTSTRWIRITTVTELQASLYEREGEVRAYTVTLSV